VAPAEFGTPARCGCVRRISGTPFGGSFRNSRPSAASTVILRSGPGSPGLMSVDRDSHAVNRGRLWRHVIFTNHVLSEKESERILASVSGGSGESSETTWGYKAPRRCRGTEAGNRVPRTRPGASQGGFIKSGFRQVVSASRKLLSQSLA